MKGAGVITDMDMPDFDEEGRGVLKNYDGMLDARNFL